MKRLLFAVAAFAVAVPIFAQTGSDPETSPMDTGPRSPSASSMGADSDISTESQKEEEKEDTSIMGTESSMESDSSIDSAIEPGSEEIEEEEEEDYSY